MIIRGPLLSLPVGGGGEERMRFPPAPHFFGEQVDSTSLQSIQHSLEGSPSLPFRFSTPSYYLLLNNSHPSIPFLRMNKSQQNPTLLPASEIRHLISSSHSSSLLLVGYAIGTQEAELLSPVSMCNLNLPSRQDTITNYHEQKPCPIQLDHILLFVAYISTIKRGGEKGTM